MGVALTPTLPLLGHHVAIVVLASGELAEFGLIATPSYQGTPTP